MILGDQSNFVGNERQLKILIKALEEGNILIWNKFNAANGPHFKANLKGINLEGLNLKEINLNGANLSGANLMSVDFRFAKLEGCNFEKAECQDADFRMATLTGSNFSNATLFHCNFSRAKMSKVNLTDSDLVDADLTGAVLTGATVKPGALGKSNIKNTVLPGKLKIKSQDNPLEAPAWVKARDEENQRKVDRLAKEQKELEEEEMRQLRRLGIKQSPTKWKLANEESEGETK